MRDGWTDQLSFRCFYFCGIDIIATLRCSFDKLRNKKSCIFFCFFRSKKCGNTVIWTYILWSHNKILHYLNSFYPRFRFVSLKIAFFFMTLEYSSAKTILVMPWGKRYQRTKEGNKDHISSSSFCILIVLNTSFALSVVVHNPPRSCKTQK